MDRRAFIIRWVMKTILGYAFGLSILLFLLALPVFLSAWAFQRLMPPRERRPVGVPYWILTCLTFSWLALWGWMCACLLTDGPFESEDPSFGEVAFFSLVPIGVGIVLLANTVWRLRQARAGARTLPSLKAMLWVPLVLAWLYTLLMMMAIPSAMPVQARRSAETGSSLREISKAEGAFKAQSGSYAWNLRALGSQARLSEEIAGGFRDNYRFDVLSTYDEQGGNRPGLGYAYCALPKGRLNRRTYVTNQSGKIWYTDRDPRTVFAQDMPWPNPEQNGWIQLGE